MYGSVYLYSEINERTDAPMLTVIEQPTSDAYMLTDTYKPVHGTFGNGYKQERIVLI